MIAQRWLQLLKLNLLYSSTPHALCANWDTWDVKIEDLGGDQLRGYRTGNFCPMTELLRMIKSVDVRTIFDQRKRKALKGRNDFLQKTLIREACEKLSKAALYPSVFALWCGGGIFRFEMEHSLQSLSSFGGFTFGEGRARAAEYL